MEGSTQELLQVFCAQVAARQNRIADMRLLSRVAVPLTCPITAIDTPQNGNNKNSIQLYLSRPVLSPLKSIKIPRFPPYTNHLYLRAVS